VSAAPPGCQRAGFDADNDVDVIDLAGYQIVSPHDPVL
jgi:hypothetical protein